jgi:type I restriction enzyme R subunit
MAFNQIHDAQQILASEPERNAFAARFMLCQGLFEFLWPDTTLRPLEEDYRFIARIYESIKPTNAADILLWHRLGAKTMAIVHEHLVDVTISSDELEKVAMDAGALEALKDLKLFDDDSPMPKPAPTALEVLSKLEERIAKRMAGSDTHKVWRSLAERLEMLRQNRIETAEASVEFLKMLLELATDLVEAEKADDEGRIDEIVVVDPRRGALTQIFEEYQPEGVPVVIETVVEKVDQLVEPVRGTGWQTSHPGDRKVRQELRFILRDSGLPVSGDLFDHAYAYIQENY